MIRFRCPACQKILEVLDEGAGSKINCPKCGQRMLVPTPAKPAAPPAAINKTVRGQLVPSPAPNPPPTSKTLPSSIESDKLVPLGLRKDAKLAVGGGEESGDKPGRSWAGTLCALLALTFTIAAMPAAVIYHLLLGAGLAACGVALALFAAFKPLFRKGLGLAAVALLVGGSVLLSIVILAGGPAAKQDEEKPSRQDKPEFDPNDFVRTSKWVLAAIDGLRKERDNGIRYRDALEKLTAEVRAYAGKNVRWALLVNSINDNQVLLKSVYLQEIRNTIMGRLLSSTQSKLLLTTDVPPKEEERGQVQWDRDEEIRRQRQRLGLCDPLVLNVGSDISKETASRLNPGDRLNINAEVVQLRVEAVRNIGSRFTAHVMIFLKNLRADNPRSPPPKRE